MDFGVSKTIGSLGVRQFSNFHPFYTSQPAIDLVNPGVNMQLYSDIVPIFVGSQTHKIEQKVQETQVNDSNGSNLQNGAGMDNEKLIEHSFLHPRPIKTEMIQLLKANPLKRKSDQKSEFIVTKKIKNEKSHKFSLV